MDDCSQTVDSACRNKTTALHLKVGATVAIAIASSMGVLIPLAGKRVKHLRTDGNFFFVAKAFAAGVILATGFCHMIPDAVSALTNPCLPESPWAKFPWPGFIAMLAALATLVVDFVGTEYYERKHSFAAHGHGMIHHHGVADGTERINKDGPVEDHSPAEAHGHGPGLIEKGGDVESKQHHQPDRNKESNNSNGGPMHIVGMRAHAASHSHSHPDGQHGSLDSGGTHHAGHDHGPKDASQVTEASLRHIVISQVLELGIVAHSVIIGLSLGVSQSPCTIRPLMAALVFHQFFEGFALGGCISQAGFKKMSAGIMATFFAITTPFGVCLGIGIASGYDQNSPHALIIEGVFDSLSAGILIYMALVDLIAADFLSRRLRCDRQLQVISFIALFGGAGAMAAIAIWA